MNFVEAHASQVCWVCKAPGVNPPEPSILGRWWPWSCARHRLVMDIVPGPRRHAKKKARRK